MSVDASDPPHFLSGTTGFALGLLPAIHLLNHLDRRAFSVVFPLLQAEWNLSDIQLGLVATAYTLAVGALSDVVGLRLAMLLPLGAALLGGLVFLLGARQKSLTF